MTATATAAPFTPTLVSDYFFNEPSSPVFHPSDLHDLHALASSPDMDSPTGGSGSYPSLKTQVAPVGVEGATYDVQMSPMGSDTEEGAPIPPFPDTAALKPDASKGETQPMEFLPPLVLFHDMNPMTDVPAGVGSPTKTIQHFSPGPVTTATPGELDTSKLNLKDQQMTAPTNHVQRVHDQLMAATTEDDTSAPPSPPLPATARQPDDRKYSACSTDSSSVMMMMGGSAPSSAPGSSFNSPETPSSNGTSHANSTVHTPSPPPLTLPQPAQATMAMNQPASTATTTTLNQRMVPPPLSVHSLFGISPTNSPQQIPQSTPTKYRTMAPAVPPAASHICPVQLPPHALTPVQHDTHAPTGPPPASAHPIRQQSTPQQPVAHAQTPQHGPSRRVSQHPHHHEHARSAHCTPMTSPVKASHKSQTQCDMNGVEYVGPFILGPVLGKGCTGTVRLGTHKRTKFEVAFKIIEKKYLQSDAKLWAKVKREIVILKLIEHPHVLKLYDILETENRLYLVLEHVKGGELFDFIVSKGRLDRDESLRIAAQIVMGLEHCHAHNICHRDLKPENLLLDEHHNIKIADFGMAQLMKKDGILKTSCGSPHYASPEIIAGEIYDAKCTDVWSIGVILYALITGSLPFDHDNIPTLLTMVTKGHYTTPSYVPPDIAHLISRMLTVDPTKRITLPEIRNHICFKGKNYFHDYNKQDGLSVESMTHKLSRYHSHPTGTAPSSSHKKHKLNPSQDRSLISMNQDSSDSDDPPEHIWRKTSINHRNHITSETKDISPPQPQPSFLTTGTVASNLNVSGSSHTPPPLPPPPSEEIDEGVLNDLESLGLGPRDGNREDLRKKIREAEAAAASGTGGPKEPSLEQVFYKLLRQRKLDRLRTLAVLSPKVVPVQPTRRFQQRHHHHRLGDGHLSSHACQPSAAGSESNQGKSMQHQPMIDLLGNSVPNSTFNSPTSDHAAAMDLSDAIQELTLPPPHPRSASVASSSTSSANHDMMETDMPPLPARFASSSGQSMYQNMTPNHPVVGAPMPSFAATQISPVSIQSSIFSGVNAFTSSLFKLAVDHNLSPKTASEKDNKMQIDATHAANPTNSSPSNQGGVLQSILSLPPSPIVSEPSQSIMTAGMPVAIGAACVASGMHDVTNAAVSTTSPPVSSPPSPAQSSMNSNSSLPSSSSGIPGAPPPLLHCYSDGSVPESIMTNDDDGSAASYYMTMAYRPI